MARPCEFITPVYQSEKGPTCSDKNFSLYKERGKCNSCPKNTFNRSVSIPAFNITDGYFASKAVGLRGQIGRSNAFRRSALKNNQ